jgi:phage protein D
MANGNGNGAAPALYYASRPIFSVDGQLQSLLGEVLLQSLLIEETTRGLFRCEARLTNWGAGRDEPFRFFDRQILDFGKSFKVELGRPGSVKQIFDGRIMALEGQYPANRPPELVVLAEDRFQDLRMERHTRTYNQVGDGDVARQIASAHGLTAEVDADGPTHGVLSQLDQSDLAFLRERADAADAEVWVEDRTLHFQTRSRRNAGSISLTYGANLHDFTVLADLAHQRSTVHVTGWDVANKSAIDESAGPDAIAGELGSDRGGSAILDEAIASRDEYLSLSETATAEAARALAERFYRSRARRFVTGSGSCDGDAGLRVGATLSLGGLGPWFDGDYYAVRVRHVFDLVDGYRTLFDVERPGIGG